MNARLRVDPVPPRAVNPTLSSELEAILLRALARDHKNRYARAADLGHDLEYPDSVRVGDSPAPGAPLSTRVWWYSALAAIPAAIASTSPGSNKSRPQGAFFNAVADGFHAVPTRSLRNPDVALVASLRLNLYPVNRRWGPGTELRPRQSSLARVLIGSSRRTATRALEP